MIQFKNTVRQIPLEEVLDRIENADGTEIDPLIQAIRNRYIRMHPDWELIILSVHRSDEINRRQQMESLIQMLRNTYPD